MLLHKISRYRPQFLWFIIWSASIYLFITEITPTYFPSVPDRPSTLSRAGPVAKRSNPARIPSLVRAVAYTTNKVKKRQSKQEVLGLDKPEGRFCSEKEYLDGEWVEREEPLRDFDDVRRAYQFGVGREKGGVNHHETTWLTVIVIPPDRAGGRRVEMSSGG